MRGVEPKIVSSKTVFSGRRVGLKILQVAIGNEVVEREVVEFGQAAAALPLIDDDTAILVEQFRSAIGGWVLEIPAGKVEPGEDPEKCIVRELEEEIGYRPRRVEKLVSVYTTPGYSNEVLHIFVAKDLEFVGAHPERYEVLRPRKMKLREVLELSRDGVVDAKTVLAVSLYLLTRKGAF